MTNTDYLAWIVSINDLLYIDTSSLMNAGWFRLFAEKAEGMLKSAGKQIIISPAVRSELLRLFDSPDQEKRDNAQAAVCVISEHSEIFQAPGGKLVDEDVSAAFADAELLTSLMKNRTDCRQLLITNDKCLSSDAYGFNRQTSCRGFPITVCYINPAGDLQMPDCVRNMRQGNIADLLFERDMCAMTDRSDRQVERFDEEPESAEAEETKVQIEDTAAAQEEKDDYNWVLAFGFGAVSGFVAGRYGKEIMVILQRALTRV